MAAAPEPDWTRIYATESVAVLPDGETIHFTWSETNWTASVTGGVARTTGKRPEPWNAGVYTNEMKAAEVADYRVSPDGTRVACRFRGGAQFRRRRGDDGANAGELWLYNGPEKTWKKLNRNKHHHGSPAWLDDNRLAYLNNNGKGGRDVRIIDFSSNTDRLLIASDADGGELPNFLSSASKTRTLVLRRGMDLWVYQLDDEFEVKSRKMLVLHPEQSWKAPVAVRKRFYESAWNNDSKYPPVATADGRDIIFAAGGDLWAIHPKDGTNKVVCLRGETRTHERNPALSPDGNTLYYLRDYGDRAEVWSMRRTDASKAWHEPSSVLNRCHVGGTAPRSRLSISPTGRWLSWTDENGFWICSTNQGATAKLFTVPGTFRYWEYKWAPNEKSVALVLGDKSTNADVWVVPLEGKESPVNVSDHLLWDGSPQWATNSSFLVFKGKWHDDRSTRYFKVDMGEKLTKGCCKIVPVNDEKKLKEALVKEDNVKLPKFKVEQNTVLADYYELAFLTIWANLRLRFYSPTEERVDWDDLRKRYLAPARNARSWRTFHRVLQQMMGELDASHLGFFATDNARKEWKIPKVTSPSQGKERKQAERKARERVAKATNGKWGYITLRGMGLDDYDVFLDDLYREGMERDGIILDLRGNTGGNCADLILPCLMVPPHGWGEWRDGTRGYLTSHLHRMQFPGKMVTLINERVFSNAEMMAHQLKMLERSELVGRSTAGGVLATYNVNVLDLGEYRIPFFRWFTQSREDMENNGAVPDVWVDDTPETCMNEEDVQLEKALELIKAGGGKGQRRFTPFRRRGKRR